MGILALLAKAEEQLRKRDKKCKIRFDAREMSLQQELAQREELWKRNVQELKTERNLVCEEPLKNEEEWKEKESETMVLVKYISFLSLFADWKEHHAVKKK
ncbi:hypothetical protein EXN66_Car002893 [Channa argus]|uniref:Uncharacterized protein n=1 Tax=Channa argus TaxID=215402 RepID=A0A6G1PA98_CHAAH|nr:hypothetical protein EXN66_Car002893 [Channa argus]